MFLSFSRLLCDLEIASSLQIPDTLPLFSSASLCSIMAYQPDWFVLPDEAENTSSGQQDAAYPMVSSTSPFDQTNTFAPLDTFDMGLQLTAPVNNNSHQSFYHNPLQGAGHVGFNEWDASPFVMQPSGTYAPVHANDGYSAINWMDPGPPTHYAGNHLHNSAAVNAAIPASCRTPSPNGALGGSTDAG